MDLTEVGLLQHRYFRKTYFSSSFIFIVIKGRTSKLSWNNWEGYNRDQSKFILVNNRGGYNISDFLCKFNSYHFFNTRYFIGNVWTILLNIDNIYRIKGSLKKTKGLVWYYRYSLNFSARTSTITKALLQRSIISAEVWYVIPFCRNYLCSLDFVSEQWANQLAKFSTIYRYGVVSV